MICPATRADIPAIVGQLKQHHQEHSFAWRFDPSLLSVALTQAINAPDNLVLVAPGAMLWARYFDCDFGSGRHASERIVRASVPGQFKRLREAYEAWARDNGCIDVALSCVRKFETFGRLYGRDGYVMAEATFVKPL